MLAPIDKLERGGNDICQVIVTRRCTLNCSNCTQLLPFRRDEPNMAPDVFRAALRSLEGWPGVRGIFGGNPCSHPRFAELMEILVEEVPDQRQRGLWSNDLMAHGALVREVFYPHGRFNLNAHAVAPAADEIDRQVPGKLIAKSRNEPARHGAILVDRRDFGIDDAAWVEMRERCDINQHWSAAIAERDGTPYAYFCEVGAALDGVRGENHGILAEPGWWRSRMDRFEHQVRECCDRGCGVPLRLRGHLDREEVYDASPAWRETLTARRQSAVDIAIHDELPDGNRPSSLVDYMRLRTAP